MPKLPRATAKPDTGTAGKAPAKPAAAADGKGGTATKRRSQGKRKGADNGGSGAARKGFEHQRVDQHAARVPAGPKARLTDDQRVLLGDLFAVVEEHAHEAAEEVDRTLVEGAFVFACERHADQRRASGEEFIVHPVGVAKICAGMRLDTATLCAALLHDTVEDTSASLEEVQDKFGDEVGALVDGVTKLTGIPEPRRQAGRELPEDDGRDGAGRPRHPDQARRPAAQHAHDRLDAEAEAAGEGEGDA